MSADPDELELANQEGYNEGLVRGFNDGIETASMVMLSAAGEHFKNGNDKLAGICRDHSDKLRMELKKIPD